MTFSQNKKKLTPSDTCTVLIMWANAFQVFKIEAHSSCLEWLIAGLHLLLFLNLKMMCNTVADYIQNVCSHFDSINYRRICL